MICHPAIYFVKGKHTWKLLVITAIIVLATYISFFLGISNKHAVYDGSSRDHSNPVITAIKPKQANGQLRKDNRADETESRTAVIHRQTITPDGYRNYSFSRCDDPNTGVTIYGTIQAGHNYSVFSSTVHNQESLNYLFNLPLAALAWQRIGFGSIVLLVVDKTRMENHRKVEFVLSTLLSLKVVVIVLQSHHNYAVMISQVSRLFVPLLVGTHCVRDPRSWEDTYLVTSDADLWPLARDIYLLPADGQTAVLCLNAFCCGHFVHNGRSYPMLPIGNIGMRVSTWRAVVRRRGFVPVSVPEIVTYFSREFGKQATSAIKKGENFGWYMDQHMISILITEWSAREGNANRVRYVRRHINHDRIDRGVWQPLTLYEKVDAHVLESAYKPEIWHRLEALLVLMYDRQLFNWCKLYATTFVSLT